ncbi:MAG: ribonuclease J [Propionibacteriaceae bacterium]|jgi:ribonuclease J|nr:ribonuclease J [Propionibacteriaceae bacterium]
MFDLPLSDPPKLGKDTLRIIPLGGLGDVGRNMTAFEINGEILLIDAGVLFPEEEHPGIDLILPGFDALADRLDDVVGLVLTHGHEDHIGAVPYLLKNRPDIEVYGSRLTLAFLEGKLKEHRLHSTRTHQVAEGDRLTIGTQFDTEFVAVNHSIPDALAVFLRTAGGTVLETGDFKMDQLPLDHRLTDLRAFARFGEEGVDLFMADSTNAEVPGFTTGELEVEPAIRRIFDTAPGKIIVACFSSHVHRVQQIVNQAHAHGRVVAYVGRSMVRNMGVARDLGFLSIPASTVADLSDVDKIPDNRVVIVCTGSQGEPLAALSRMANREHPSIKIGPTDTVLLASSLIPGNENAVYRVINGLMKLGAKVVHKANALVHVSGHASAGELLYCYNIVKPQAAMPIHGEARHLIANANLATATGVANTLAVDDGTVVDLKNHQARVVGKVDASYILVDAGSTGLVSEELLADRRILGSEGFIAVVAVVSAEKKAVVSLDIHARGFVDEESIFAPVEDLIITNLTQALKDGMDDTYLLQQTIRRTVGKWVGSALRSRPMILPVVVGGADS